MKTYHQCISVTSGVLAIINFLTCISGAQTPTNITMGMRASELASNNARLFNEFTNQAQIDRSYRAGLISKDEAMQASALNENRGPMNIYGKVIDQYGNPIAGVDVTGSIAIRQGWYLPDKWETYKTQTGANGLFLFQGLKGADWALNVEKEGYEMDYKRGWSGPRGGPHGTQTSPSDRAILTMWKNQGAEPMIQTEIQAGLACNGIPRSFDLLSGQRFSTNGDLVVTLIRNPVHIDRRKHFDWTLTLSIPSGGMIGYRSGYMYEAPEKGYQQTVVISMPANTNNWTPSIRRSFYFKSRDGRNYGVMTINLMANYEPPPTHLEIDAYVNPVGSRNLEIDPKKVTIVHK